MNRYILLLAYSLFPLYASAAPPQREPDFSFLEASQDTLKIPYSTASCVQKRVKAKSLLNEILKRVAQKKGFSYEAFSEGWINKIQCTDGRKSLWVYGHQLGLNSSVASRLCADKSATACLLTQAQIPCAEHFLISTLARSHSSSSDPWRKALSLSEPYNFSVVLKPKEGGGSQDVYKTRTWPEVQEALSKILSKGSDAVLSPFYNFKSEYRTLLYNNVPLICFEKQRPSLHGDGQRTLRDLLASFIQETPIEKISYLKKALPNEETPLDRVMMPGEEFMLEWKYAMGIGSHARLLNLAEAKKIASLAVRAAETLCISFCAVDCFYDESGLLRVLEINSAPTLDHISEEYGTAGDEILASIYEKVLSSYFSE